MAKLTCILCGDKFSSKKLVGRRTCTKCLNSIYVLNIGRDELEIVSIDDDRGGKIGTFESKKGKIFIISSKKSINEEGFVAEESELIQVENILEFEEQVTSGDINTFGEWLRRLNAKGYFQTNVTEESRVAMMKAVLKEAKKEQGIT